MLSQTCNLSATNHPKGKSIFRRIKDDPNYEVLCVKALLEKVREIAQPIASSIGVTLDKVEYKKAGKYSVLQIVIHREGGTGIQDCETVSRTLEEKLDALEIIPERYSLEVTSRGI